MDATLTLGDEVVGGTPGPVASTTKLTLDRRSYAYGASTVARVQASAARTPAVTPTGTVLLSVAGQTVSGELTGGAATLRLPEAVKPGRRTITVRYGGAGRVASSTTATSVRVTKAAPVLRIKPAKRALRAGQRLRIRVVAAIAGSSRVDPVGQVVVRIDGRAIATATLLRRHHGAITLRSPRLRAGKHLFTATLAGTRLQTAARSTIKKVRVVRSG